MRQLCATFANSQSCRQREILSPGPCIPTTCKASLHTLPSREAVEDASSSSDQASPSLSHIGLFGRPIFHSSSPKRGLEILPRLFLLPQLCAIRGAHNLEDIRGEEGSTDVSIEEGTEGLTDQHRRRFFCISKKKSWPCGRDFPGTFHSMDAVRKHTIHRIQVRPNALRSAFPRNFGGSQRQPFARHFLHQALGPRPLTRIFCTLQGFVQRNPKC